MEKITVCQVMAGDEEGGLEKHFVELCNALKNECNLIVICHEKYRDRFDESIQVESIDMARSRKNPFILYALYKTIKKYSPDIIHAHASKAAAMIGVIKPFLDGCYIVSVHALKKNMKVYSKYDSVIAVSRGVAELIRNTSKFVIYNGVEHPDSLPEDGKVYLNDNFKIDASRPVVSSVGRMVSVKGFDVLLDAWRDVDAELILVGDGPDRMELEARAARYGLEKRVHFAGYREDVHAILASVDLVVIASRREGFSYVVAESLMCKVSIVSTDVPVANEILPNKYLVPTGDFVALAKKINWALGNMDEVQKDFENIFVWADQNLTIENMMNKTMDVYLEVLG